MFFKSLLLYEQFETRGVFKAKGLPFLSPHSWIGIICNLLIGFNLWFWHSCLVSSFRASFCSKKFVLSKSIYYQGGNSDLRFVCTTQSVLDFFRVSEGLKGLLWMLSQNSGRIGLQHTKTSLTVSLKSTLPFTHNYKQKFRLSAWAYQSF